MLKTFNTRQALWHGAGPLARGRPFGTGQALWHGAIYNWKRYG